MFDINYCREFNRQRGCANRESDCSHKVEECLFGFKQDAQNVRVFRAKEKASISINYIVYAFVMRMSRIRRRPGNSRLRRYRTRPSFNRQNGSKGF